MSEALLSARMPAAPVGFGVLQTMPVTPDPEPDADDTPSVVLELENDDGTVTVSLDGKSLVDDEDDTPPSWYDNLAERLDGGELGRVADDLLRGIREDMMSRQDYIESRAEGLKLLGLRSEIGDSMGDTNGVAGTSRVRHPLLLEALLRFQANARSEMLPTDGPVKVRDDAVGSTPERDRLANALEKDLNHYLTATATEYYPDTDRMLLMLGFGGTAFKKVYFCPIRRRPVSESVDASDLIVNQSATDLRNARRVTHRVLMTHSTLKRLQILGVYRDIPLAVGVPIQTDALKQEQQSIAGISPTHTAEPNEDREIYECYCELDLKGYEHKWKGKPSGLEVPYRATIDVASQQILSLVRNYAPDDEELPQKRDTFVKYAFVPGFGFYDIGLLHILGNTTNALTAAWRELLDAGMYACFPGFLYGDTGGRQNTNMFRVPPGGGAPIKTQGLRIQDAVMPLPYKEPSPALMQLADNMAQTGMRVGGTSEQAVGEGRADAPVGTTLALIEQAQKVLNAVHKRMHAAQADEFRLLVREFREHPESFWERCRKPTIQWNETLFTQALNDCELVPQADPNTASHSQRLMKVAALKQLQAAQPGLYDPIAVDKMALVALGWSNPEQFMAPPAAQGAPPPELLAAQAKAASEAKTADARMLQAQTGAAEAQARIMGGDQSGPSEMEMALKAKAEETRAQQVAFQQQRASVDDANRDKDREADMAIEQAKLVADMLRLDAESALPAGAVQEALMDLGNGIHGTG